MSKNKQANIASFFTRQPKPAGAVKGEAASSPNENAGPSAAAAAKPTPKRKPEQVRGLPLGWDRHHSLHHSLVHADGTTCALACPLFFPPCPRTCSLSAYQSTCLQRRIM